MICALILTIPAALWLLYKFPFWEASRDHAAIEANGSADTLKERFHFWRGMRRGVIQALVVCAAAAPLASRSLLAAGLLAGALGVAGLAWFFVTFNIKLSLLRGLDPYYISSDPRAAFFPDRYVYRHAFNAAPVNASGAYVKVLASSVFKTLLTVILWVAFTTATLAASAALYLASRPNF